MAFYRKDCLNVNGFNNEFEGWGREDSEFVVRLINSGVKRKIFVLMRYNFIYGTMKILKGIIRKE